MKQPRIYFCSGPIQSGKSSRLGQWAQRREDVDGILAPVIEGRRHLQHIASGVIKCVQLPAAQWKSSEAWQIGAYFFSIPVFEWARQILLQSSRQKPEWLIVDEAGFLELDGRGLEPALTKILRLNSDKAPANIVFVVRESLVNRMAEHFNLDEKTIKIEGEADPIAIEKIIHEVGYTPVQLQEENNQS